MPAGTLFDSILRPAMQVGIDLESYMPSGEWVRWLGRDVQMRTSMTLDRLGQVTHFTVQV